MTRYNTRPQFEESLERRRVGLIALFLMWAAGAYFLVEYLRVELVVGSLASGIPLFLAVLLFAFSLVPLTSALGRRLHPTGVEVSPRGLTLEFARGAPRTIPWADRPVDAAYDTRSAPRDRRHPPGMEVTVWVPVPGRDPTASSFRPEELRVSGKAFDEIRKGMRQAGFRAVAQTWSRTRPGDLIQFLAPDEEARPAPAVPARWSFLGRRGMLETPGPPRDLDGDPPKPGTP